jgi:hypothetical protein
MNNLRMAASRRAALVLGVCLLGAVGLAQGVRAQGAPARVRATITAVDGDSLSLTARNGDKLVVVLTPDVKIGAVATTTPADIKPGSFIGCAAIPLPDGSLKALEVTVFPPALNGTGEGHYAWDLTPASTMTNGFVGGLVVAENRVMTVTYKGGEKKIVVPDDVPIVMVEPGDRAMLTPGAHVLVVPTKAADGTLSANRITVGKNGIVPPA